MAVRTGAPINRRSRTEAILLLERLARGADSGR
jgi:hypothetical protein